MCQPCQTTSTNGFNTLCKWCHPSGSSIQFPYFQRTLNLKDMENQTPKLWEITFFFQAEKNSSKRAKLEAEWNNFKYELSDWSKDYQAIYSPTVISTEWALQWFLRHKASYSRIYLLLLQVRNMCISAPLQRTTFQPL